MMKKQDKKMKRSKDVATSDVVYDDDTDSDIGEDDLKTFRANLNSIQTPGHGPEQSSSDSMSESDESGTESTEADEVAETKERGIKRAHVDAKLSALHNLLGDQPDEQDEDSDEESSDDEMSHPGSGLAENGPNVEDGKNSSESSDSDSSGTDVESDSEQTPAKKSRKSSDHPSQLLPSQQNRLDKEDKIRAEFREKIRSMSMEELQQMKQEIGTKAMDKILGLSKKPSQDKSSKKRASSEAFKRENKNRPRETSSKKTVGRFRDVVGLTSDQKTQKRDPRFDSLCGEFDAKVFKDSYKFVQDIKSRELKDLKEQLKNDDGLDEETRGKIKYLIQRSENQAREKAKLDKRKESEKEQKKRNRELAAEGKRPQFMTKREKQNVELVDKFEELKNSGKLENYMKKKSKKNLAKDRKKIKDFS